MADSLISDAQRRNVRARWDRTTADERKTVMRRVRDARTVKLTASVAADFDRLGIIPTGEQIATATARVLKLKQQQAVEKARATLALQRAKEQAELDRLKLMAYQDPWANRVMHVATGWIDHLTAMCQPSPWSPSAANNFNRTIAKVVYLMVADELEKPQDHRDFQYLSHRFADYELWVHSATCPKTRLIGAPCVVCGLDGSAALGAVSFDDWGRSDARSQ